MKVIVRIWAKELGTALILGKPMLWWCLSEVKKARFIDEVFVWAENEELARIAQGCDCHVVLRTPDQVFSLEDSFDPDEWGHFLDDSIMSKCGTSGDVWVFMNCNSCLITGEILEDMFVKLMEAKGGDTISPVCKTDPGFHMMNPKTGHLFPIWFYPGMDRQDYPDLYKVGNIRIKRRREPYQMQRLLYHEVAQEFVFEVQNQEDVRLADYYLGLRLGGEIVLPNTETEIGKSHRLWKEHGNGTRTCNESSMN
jgi:CMP-N-acetylneuraminic acid synthetase